MKRVLALLGAVALVAGALALRGALDDDSTDVGTNGGEPVDDPGDGSPLVVACIPELEAACEESVRADQVLIQDPAVTIAAIEAGEDIDAWVTLHPWPEIAIVGGAQRSFFETTAAPLASSALVLVERDGAADEVCGGDDPDWSCAVEVPRQRAAVPAPHSALGTLVLGWAALEWSSVTRPNEPFARQELELPEFQNWLDRIDLSTDDPVLDALQLGNAGPLVIGTSAADVADRITPSPRGDGLVAFPGAGTASVAVVVVGPAAQRIAEDPTIARGLRDLGWSTEAPALTTGLPNAGVLFALAQEVS